MQLNLKQLKEDLKLKELERAKLLGKKEELQKRLHEEFQISSLEEANQILDILEKEKDKIETELSSILDGLEDLVC